MQEWKVIKLKDCIEETTERTIKNNQYKILTSSQDGICLQEEYFNKQVASKDNIGYKIIRKGEFTYRSMSDTGKFIINRLENVDIGIISPAYPVFKAIDIEPEYLKYFFQSELFRKAINNLSQGSTRVALKIDKLKEIELAIPTRKEQKKIADILSNVDCIIDKISEDIANIQRQKQGVMKQLIIKGIGHKNFKKTELGSIPKEWKIKRLSDILEIYRGGSPRPISKYITKEKEGVNWIKIGDTIEGTRYICSTKEKIRKEGITRSRMVYENELLLSNSMSFGKPYILKTNGCIHDGWLVLKNYQNVYTTDFLYYLLSSDIIKKQYEKLAAGSGVKNLNKDLVGSIKVPVLDKKEQSRISVILNKLDDKLDLEERKKQEYQNLKKGLMQQLLTGKVRVKI